MHAKLNQSLVVGLQPGPRDISVIDTRLRGFELRVRASGAKVWGYRHRLPDGRQRRFVLGHFPGIGATEARRRALEVAGDVAKGIDVVSRKHSLRAEGVRLRLSTLGSFLEKRYQSWAKTHLRTADFQLERIRVDFADWLEKPMSDIARWQIEEWRRARIEAGNTAVTVNRNLQRLQAVLSKAVEWKIIDHHPFAGLRPLKTDRSGRVRYLQEHEEANLRAGLLKREQKMRDQRESFNRWRIERGRKPFPARTEEFVDHLRPLVIVALNTGLRRGELFNLKWQDINLDTKWMDVQGETAKSGQTRRVPLNAEAIAILAGWLVQASEIDRNSHVFPGVDGDRLTTIATAWRGLTKTIGMTDFRFHDLRHHFASRLVQSGIDLNTVRELLGHADLDMVLRYAHLSPDRLSMAIEKVAR
jgi:integrase